MVSEKEKERKEEKRLLLEEEGKNVGDLQFDICA